MKPPPASNLVNRVILLTLMLLVFTGTLGLGAVWMRQEISQTANRSRALEDQFTDVARRLDEVNADVAAAVNPDALLRQNGSPELKLAARRNREIFRVETVSFAAFKLQPEPRVVTASLQ
jgi:hypothetical protein